MHVRVGARNDRVSSMTYDRRFRHTIVFALEDLPFFKSAVLFQGCRFRNQHRTYLNMFCRVNQADRAQNYIGPRAKSLECRAQNECRVNAPENSLLRINYNENVGKHSQKTQ